MKQFHGALAAVAAIVLSSGTATACDGEKAVRTVSATKAYSCASTASAKTVSTGASCSYAKAAGLTASSCSAVKAARLSSSKSCCKTTHVMFRVGENDTFDRDEATRLAETNGAEIRFVAAGEVYEDENAAKMAMTMAMVTRMNEMLQVSTTVSGESYGCAMSAARTAESTGKPLRYIVAGREFESKDDARAFLVKVKTAVDEIVLIDAEGKAVEGCAVSHCKTNGKTAFVLGDETIHCPVSANYTAAQARMAAILSAEA